MGFQKEKKGQGGWVSSLMTIQSGVLTLTFLPSVYLTKSSYLNVTVTHKEYPNDLKNYILLNKFLVLNYNSWSCNQAY